MEPQIKRLRDYWNKCSYDVRATYGEDYYEDFKVSCLIINVSIYLHRFHGHFVDTPQTCLENHMSGAKPAYKIHEVIDDLVDAVVGSEPVVSIDRMFQVIKSTVPVEIDNADQNMFLSITISKSIKSCKTEMRNSKSDSVRHWLLPLNNSKDGSNQAAVVTITIE